MPKKRYTEEQISFALRQAKAGQRSPRFVANWEFRSRLFIGVTCLVSSDHV